jgi:hypothetical protein
MRRTLKTALTLIIVLALIAGSAYFGYHFSLVKKHTSVEKEILLEKVNNVFKFGTVEGVFSEIFNYSDYYTYNISPLRKKALIRIRATVLVGFNLDSIDININSLTQKIILSNVPEPGIISIDHELDYYDITEGYFNSFSTQDLNMLQKQSKDFIRKKVMQSSLMETAERQLNQNLQMLNWALIESGWEIEIKEEDKSGFWN